jgi:hypothetical protein
VLRCASSVLTVLFVLLPDGSGWIAAAAAAACCLLLLLLMLLQALVVWTS